MYFFVYFAENLMSNGLMTPIRSPIFPMSPCVSINNHNHRSSSLPKKPSRHSLSINPGAICQDGDTYPTSFLTQVIVLMTRNIRIMTRDRVLTYMRFLIHLSIAITVGILYFQIGKDAHFMQNNFNFLFFAIMFLMFTAFNSMMLTCKFSSLLFSYLSIDCIISFILSCCCPQSCKTTPKTMTYEIIYCIPLCSTLCSCLL